MLDLPPSGTCKFDLYFYLGFIMAQRLHTLLITGLTLLALLSSSVSASVPLMSLKMLSMQSMNSMSHESSAAETMVSCPGMMKVNDHSMSRSSSAVASNTIVMENCHDDSSMEHDTCCLDACSTHCAISFHNGLHFITYDIRLMEYYEVSYFIPNSHLSSLYRPPIA